MSKKKFKYKYSFSDGTNITKKYCISGGLVHPQNARRYAIQFFDIVKSLISENYEILDCKVVFTDDEDCPYGEMVLVKNKVFDEQGIKDWENEYLNGKGKYRWEKNYDMIYPMCSIYMNLQHIDNMPFLTVESNMVVNNRAGKHKGRKIDGKYHLKHSCVAKLNNKGQFVSINKGCWVNKSSERSYS